MFHIFIASILFGLVHPGSKLIMSSGLDLISFCLLYVLIRFLAQLPFMISQHRYLVGNAKAWLYLAAIGLTGAGLQLCEFAGIKDGLPVPTVTFLVYSHPVWSLLLSRVINHEPLSLVSFLKLSSGLIGIICIVEGSPSFYQADLPTLLAPMTAGVLIALWVSLSKQVKSLGTSIWTISFYYDFFALLALLAIRIQRPGSSMTLTELARWLQSPLHLASILAYAIFVGLVPNLLFYTGNATTTARAAGLILLIEPLVATLVSHFIWIDRLSDFFFVGALFIVITATPIETAWFKRLKKRCVST